MIDLRNVTKLYDNGVEAVQNINLHIDDGEFVYLVGESGSGKSTLLKLLMRELVASTGEVIVNKKNLGRLRRSKVAEYRRTLGVVFQDFRLLPSRTVYDNVAYAMEVIEQPTKAIRRRVPVVLNMVGLSKKYKCLPSEISGGEQQRTAIARAVVNNPIIVLADEPTGNLDPKNSEDIILLMEAINAKGTTVIIATHDRNLVDRHKKRVIELKNGVIVRDDKEGGYTGEAPQC